MPKTFRCVVAALVAVATAVARAQGAAPEPPPAQPPAPPAPAAQPSWPGVVNPPAVLSPPSTAGVDPPYAFDVTGVETRDKAKVLMPREAPHRVVQDGMNRTDKDPVINAPTVGWELAF
jgi:hypothetical protein